MMSVGVRSLLVSALVPMRRPLVARRLLQRPMCSAPDASPFPEWMIAPHVPAAEWVACAISHFEAGELDALKSQAPSDGTTRLEGDLLPQEITCDVGMRRPTAVELTPSHVRLYLGETAEPACVAWKFLAKVVKKKKQGAWQLDSDCDEPPELIQGFSDGTQRTASLYPVERGPPTAILGGFNMHRMKSIDPGEDTARKLGALGSAKGGLRGRVLDVCTGLGYTCLGASRTAFVDHVVTIELDPLMVEMQRANPWSADLFTDEKVTRLLGDATEIVPQLPEGYFNFVVHDPPTNHMSGELYSAEFYAALRRTLKPGGTLYHYVGDPASKASGRLFKGIIERLRDVGFEEVKSHNKAYGIVAR